MKIAWLALESDLFFLPVGRISHNRPTSNNADV
jgi:hypothetical protein